MTPLSPRLAPDSRSGVLQQLDRARVPTVGQNSVVIAILSALGTEPRDASFEYDEPYPQLPRVSVAGRAQASGCVAVSAVVDGAAAAGYARVLLTGTFCLAAPAQWTSTDFRAEPASVR